MGIVHIVRGLNYYHKYVILPIKLHAYFCIGVYGDGITAVMGNRILILRQSLPYY